MCPQSLHSQQSKNLRPIPGINRHNSTRAARPKLANLQSWLATTMALICRNALCASDAIISRPQLFSFRLFSSAKRSAPKLDTRTRIGKKNAGKRKATQVRKRGLRIWRWKLSSAWGCSRSLIQSHGWKSTWRERPDLACTVMPILGQKFDSFYKTRSARMYREHLKSYIPFYHQTYIIFCLLCARTGTMEQCARGRWEFQSSRRSNIMQHTSW